MKNIFVFKKAICFYAIVFLSLFGVVFCMPFLAEAVDPLTVEIEAGDSLSNPTNASPIDVVVTFSQSVTNFDPSSELSLDNAVYNSYTVNGFDNIYTVNIIPASHGTVTTSVVAAVASRNGVDNDASNIFTVEYDVVPPYINEIESIINPTNDTTPEIGVNVEEFATWEIFWNALEVTEQVYTGTSLLQTISLTTLGEGVYDLVLKATDLAGNEGQLNLSEFRIDTTRPIINFSSLESTITNESTFDLDIIFTEGVTGFSMDDILFSNCTLSNFQVASSSVYSVTIAPGVDGEVTVDIDENLSYDSANNGNEEAVQFSIEYDSTKPAIESITPSELSPTNADVFNVDIVFTEDITGLLQSEILVTNATVTNLVGGGAEYTVTVDTQNDDNNMTLSIAADSFEDAAENTNNLISEYLLEYDETAPVISETTAVAALTNNLTNDTTPEIGVTVESGSYWEIKNGSTVLGSSTGNDAEQLINLSPSLSDATYSLTLEAIDQAGNITVVSLTSFTIDATRPTVNPITSSELTLTNESTFEIEIEFSELTDFEQSHISTSNANLSGFSTIDNITFTVDVSPIVDGDVVIDIDTNKAYDPAGNGNYSIAQQFIIEYDSTKPTVDSITPSESDPTNADIFDVDIVFKEDVTGLLQSEILVTNATVTNLIGSGEEYTVTIDTLNDDEDMTLSIVADSFEDDAENTNNIVNEYLLEYDKTPPVISINTVVASYINQSSLFVDIDVEFGANWQIMNGVIEERSGGGNGETTIELTSLEEGTYNLELRGTDLAGNVSTALFNEFVVDLTNPTIQSITSTETSPTNSNFLITVLFSEVTDFELSDFTEDNCVISNLQTSDNITYTANVAPIIDGNVTIDINAGIVLDRAGNGNDAATQFSIVYDGTFPTIDSITSLETSPTNEDLFEISIVLSELTDFELSDISVGNGGKSNLQTSDSTTFTVDISPDFNGEVTVDIDAGFVNDLAGNGNIAASQYSIVYDSALPSLVENTVVFPSLTNNNTPDVGITVESGLNWTIKNGLVLISTGIGTGVEQTVTLGYPLGLADGTYNSTLEATDDAGNTNSISLTEFIIDTALPIPVVTGETEVNSETFEVSIIFNEDVPGFDKTGLTVGNGIIIGSLFINSDSDYVVTIDPDDNEEVSINVNANVVTDRAGNLNIEHTGFTVKHDTVSPIVDSITVEPSSTNGGEVQVEIDFIETNSGLDYSELPVVTIDGLSNSYIVTQDSYNSNTWIGRFIVNDDNEELIGSVVVNSAEDLAGNIMLEDSDDGTISVDSKNPTVSIVSDESSYTNLSPFDVDIVFSEWTSDFAGVGDVIVSNGTIIVEGSDGESFSGTVTPLVEGAVTINVNADVAQDSAGNSNLAASEFSIDYDITSPTVSISSAESVLTNESSFSVMTTFSEIVSGFGVSDLSLTNAFAANLLTADSTVYTFDITPLTDGELTIDLLESMLTDSAGNDNVAASQFTITYDSIFPSTTITSTENSPSNADNFPLTVSFGEEVRSFELLDIDISNGVATSFTTLDNITFTFDLAPSLEGIVSVSILADIAEDLAGNGNTAAIELEIEYDNTAPTQPYIETQTVESEEVIIIAAPASGEYAWIAPYGTTEFYTSDTMTRLTGNGSLTTIEAPENEGSYRLYLLDEASNISTPSSNYITVDNTADEDERRRDRDRRRRRRDREERETPMNEEVYPLPSSLSTAFEIISIVDKELDLPSSGKITENVSLLNSDFDIEVKFQLGTLVTFEDKVYTGTIPTPERLFKSEIPAEVPYDDDYVFGFFFHDIDYLEFDTTIEVRFDIPEDFQGYKDLIVYEYNPLTYSYDLIDSSKIKLLEKRTKMGIILDHLSKIIVVDSTERNILDKRKFADIRNHWAREYVDYLSEKGIIKKAGNFMPNFLTTRAELLKMCIEAFDIKTDEEAEEFLFTDVDLESWKARYINKAKEEGYINGYEDGTFRPDEGVTRAEALKIVLSIAEVELDKKLIQGELFDDVPINSWFAKFVEFAKKNNIVSGKTNVTFDPNGKVTRAEAAKIIFKLLKELKT